MKKALGCRASSASSVLCPELMDKDAHSIAGIAPNVAPVQIVSKRACEKFGEQSSLNKDVDGMCPGAWSSALIQFTTGVL